MAAFEAKKRGKTGVQSVLLDYEVYLPLLFQGR